MLIGKVWDDANQRHYWGEATNFGELVETLKNVIADYGGNDEFDPAKIEVWSAVKMKVVATYGIERADE